MQPLAARTLHPQVLEQDQGCGGQAPEDGGVLGLAIAVEPVLRCHQRLPERLALLFRCHLSIHITTRIHDPVVCTVQGSVACKCSTVSGKGASRRA